jgi:hypothetical protein
MKKAEIGSSELSDRRVVPLNRCFHCKREQMIFARETEYGGKSLNFIGVCRNENCFRFLNLSLLQNWVHVPNAQVVRMEQIEINNAIH